MGEELMRNLMFVTGSVVVVCGCFLSSSQLPRAGDTVAPRLARPLTLKAGKVSEIWVDLTATNASGTSRRLGFSASPTDDPVATLTFFDAEGKTLGEEEVRLSERC